MALSNNGRRLPLLLSIAGIAAFGSAALAQGAATFAGQAEAGKQAYAQNCAACHGDNLQGQIAPTLRGNGFLGKWGAGAKTAGDLYAYIHANMPPGQSSQLSDATHAALVAFIMRENGGTAPAPLVPDAIKLAALSLPAPTEAAVGGLSTRVHPLPPGPAIPNPLATYTPVTEALLADPPAEEWPAWRRSHRGLGYSPLKQIDTANVGQLRVAWAQALPAGINMNEPLVHNGVLYVFGFGDQVFAFDAASGRQLWRYQREVPPKTPLTFAQDDRALRRQALHRDLGQPHGRARCAHRPRGVGRGADRQAEHAHPRAGRSRPTG